MKKIIIIINLILILPLFISCDNINNPNTENCVKDKNTGEYVCELTLTTYFDTTSSLKLYYGKNDVYDVKEIFNYFEDTIIKYHVYFDKYNEYDGVNNLYTINHSEDFVNIDKDFLEAIKFGIQNSYIIIKDDLPLFNIALGPVLDIWHNAREDESCDFSIQPGVSYCNVPIDEISINSFNTDMLDIELNSLDNSVKFLKHNMSIDLGGYGKGYVASIISNYLDNLNITYLLNLGQSNIVVGGENPNKENGDFYIALTKPSTDVSINPGYFLYLKISSGDSLVTSGIYQRFFIGINDDKIYHHIIDPRTNYPGGYCKSVTIIYSDSALADILSTAIFLLPIDEAIDFVNNYDDLEAVWYVDKNDIIYSDGFENYVYTP